MFSESCVEKVGEFKSCTYYGMGDNCPEKTYSGITFDYGNCWYDRVFDSDGNQIDEKISPTQKDFYSYYYQDNTVEFKNDKPVFCKGNLSFCEKIGCTNIDFSTNNYLCE